MRDTTRELVYATVTAVSPDIKVRVDGSTSDMFVNYLAAPIPNAGVAISDRVMVSVIDRLVTIMAKLTATAAPENAYELYATDGTHVASVTADPGGFVDVIGGLLSGTNESALRVTQAGLVSKAWNSAFGGDGRYLVRGNTTQGLIVQGGHLSGATNGSGDVSVTFPEPFPSACLACIGNVESNAAYTFIVSASPTTTVGQFRVNEATAGAPYVGGVSFDWIAIGY